jgi:hypothetical protein
MFTIFYTHITSHLTQLVPELKITLVIHKGCFKSVSEHFHDTMECIPLQLFYCSNHDWELVVWHRILHFILWMELDLKSLGFSDTKRPPMIVMMKWLVAGVNQNARRKPASASLSTITPFWTVLELKPGLCGEKNVSHCLGHITVFMNVIYNFAI